jgi:hypothetical protein
MIRICLYAAASTLVLAGFAGAALSQPAAKQNLPLDAGGKPCDGVLDFEKNCLNPSVTRNTPERPYRGKPYDPDTYMASEAPNFVRRGQELIYIATPGGVSDDADSAVYNGEGIIVLDPKANYAFVKRIALQHLPASMKPEEVAGMMASPATNLVYISTRGHLIALDLRSEQIVWNNTYEPVGTCCERGQVTPDGLTLEVGSNLQNFHRVIDAKTGKLKGIIPTPQIPNNHNMVMSADGKTVFDAPNGLTLTVASMETLKPIKTITFSDHIRPLVINSDATRVYANLNNLLGFEIADVESGSVVKRVEVPGEMWKAKWADPNRTFFGHGAPMHAIGLTPDESELWIGDAINDQLLVFDNQGHDNWKLNMSKALKLDHSADWITMGLDGKRAYLSSGDVVDVASHKIVGKLKDEYGHLIHSEKILDMSFDPNGHLLRVVNQFANGDPEAVARRLAAEYQTQRKKEASN